jgi:meiotically up-regulated gene 157 (Mug157) protein
MLFFAPVNAMACVELGHVQEMLRRLVSSDSTSLRIESLLSSAASLQRTICDSLTSLVAAAEKDAAGVLPYEVDGYGDAYHMDDANVPSLLSLPLLGFLSADHPVYRATRQFTLSARNPYFFNGTAGQGVGSPHGKGYNYTWPIGIVVRAMTSDSDEEIQYCLDMVCLFNLSFMLLSVCMYHMSVHWVVVSTVRPLIISMWKCQFFTEVKA